MLRACGSYYLYRSKCTAEISVYNKLATEIPQKDSFSSKKLFCCRNNAKLF